MRYAVYWKKHLDKKIQKLPHKEKEMFAQLVLDLQDKGPVQKKWQNFSKIRKNEYHCHLSYSWVACWRVEKKSINIEIYYAGSRENAPY